LPPIFEVVPDLVRPCVKKRVMSEAKRKKCLITGACGYIGRYLVKMLKADYDLYLTDVREEEVEGLPCLAVDLMNFAELSAIMEGMDLVVHLAIASPRKFLQHRTPWVTEMGGYSTAMLNTNVTGTYHVFEAAKTTRVKRVVFFSSLTVYFGNQNRLCYDQSTPLEPASLYACTKMFGETLSGVYWREHGMSMVGLRIGQPYPSGSQELDDQCLHSRRVRSIYVALEDIARAVLCAIETSVEYGVFNIVSASDNQRYDLKPATEIGYRPIGYFSGEGLMFYPEGNFPICDRPMSVED
jgi:uronate dehydrogenase